MKRWIWIFALLSMIGPAEAQIAARGDPWQRTDLAPRERSIVALAALIAQNQTAQMPCHFNLALENGVEPSEISEIITHLAFFSGWANAISAAAIAKDVFVERGIDDRQLAPTLGDLFLIIDEIGVDQLVQSRHLLRGLWQRPDLTPRDRKLVTVSALIASGNVSRIPDHFMRSMDGGLLAPETWGTAAPRS
jgi:4-carboxymuconolactone decarboxylase